MDQRKVRKGTMKVLCKNNYLDYINSKKKKADGNFIGIAFIPKKKSNLIVEMLEKKNPEYKNKYYVDIFNELIKEKEKIKILNIFDYWTEIDTLKDLNHLRKILMKPDLFKVDLSYPVVFVSGQIRTGKVILVKLLSTLPKFEKPLMSAIFEQIFTLKHINQISNTVSNYLITKFLNSLHYNQAIGRDLNLRTNEITSLKEYQKPERYLAKAKQKNAYSTFRKSLKKILQYLS